MTNLRTMNPDFSNWLQELPKAELHLHLDGSLQAHRLLSLAKKNGVDLPYSSVDDIEAAYAFKDLQSFLDLYYLGASVLQQEDDFYLLMMDYLEQCRAQNIVHTEIMIEPQTYAPNGVSFATMMNGFQRAIADAKQDWGQSVLLILSFLRHLSEADAIDTLHQAEVYREDFVAIGLASSELGNPPEKFTRLYQQARERGYRAVAHAGEEGPPEFVWGALNQLKVDRIDHGVRAIEDEALLETLINQQIPLTVCPLSNVRLCVYANMEQHTILRMLDCGVCVTVNSDDPAYFGGYLMENFLALHSALDMNQNQARQLITNGFTASFLPDSEKRRFLEKLTQINDC